MSAAADTRIPEETYWAWTIALPISAVFIGASFSATAVLFAWGLQQRE